MNIKMIYTQLFNEVKHTLNWEVEPETEMKQRYAKVFWKNSNADWIITRTGKGAPVLNILLAFITIFIKEIGFTRMVISNHVWF